MKSNISKYFTLLEMGLSVRDWSSASAHVLWLVHSVTDQRNRLTFPQYCCSCSGKCPIQLGRGRQFDCLVGILSPENGSKNESVDHCRIT